MLKSDDNLLMGLVERTLAKPESERESFLRCECGGDGDLFEKVWSRVQWEKRMKGFLTKPFPWPRMDRFFEPEQLLAGRFRLLREVGEGGMSVVYEARDERLNKRIAIKCPKPGFEQRLPPEAISATKIAHPNICKVYEIHTESTPDGEVDFLTMEFLDGETLSKRIESRLPVDQVRNLAQQICGGLEEAHRNGVIHGDLKTGNIILVEHSAGGRRAVITDFGLARLTTGLAAPKPRNHEQRERLSSLSSMTTGPPAPAPQESLRGGTFDYMAHELFRGVRSSVASDVYALGVILYQALGGSLPFPKGIDPYKRPTSPPKLASMIGWRAGRRLDWILSRCLDPDPVRRPASAAELSAAIAFIPIIPSVKALLAILVVALSISFASPNPVSVAVLAFDTSRAEQSLADTLLAETSTLLRQVKVSGWRFSTIPVSESINKQVKTAEQANLELGATHVLHGAFQREDGLITVRAKVTDIRAHQVIGEAALRYAHAEMKQIPQALAGVVTASLRVPPVPENPVNAEAYPYYVAGRDHLRQDSGADDAIALLQEAAKLDSSSAPVSAALAHAYFLKYKLSSDSSYEKLAIETARRATALNPDSAPVHLTTGMLLLDSGQYAAALEEFQRTVELTPNDSDAWLRLARAYERLSQPQEALRTLQRAIRAEPHYYSPYRALGAFYYYRAEYEKAIEQFRRVVELIPAAPEGHVELAIAYVKLGRYQEAESELRNSLELRETRNALITLGALLVFQRRDAEAIPFYKRTCELTPNNYLVWMNLADACRRTNAPGEAAEAYQRAHQLTRQEIQRNPQNAEIRACMAYLLARLGNAEDAVHEAIQARALSSVNAETVRMVVRTYEALGRRERTLEVLKDAPRALLEDITRLPEMEKLSRDPGFVELLAKH